MSNIPKNRKHLIELIDKNFDKLWTLLEDLDEKHGKLSVDSDFSIKDIVIIRLWWLEAVQSWVKDGKKGKTFPLPADGYSWRETPALNLATAKKSKHIKLLDARKKLKRSNTKLLKLIASLTDQELCKAGKFDWAGKWPVMRWISIGSSSQYDGAMKLIRKALKKEGLL